VAVSSMTGFARAEGEQEGASWSCEIKSVNSKGLDIRCRLPFGFDGLEQPVRDAAAKRFQRGSLAINFSLTRRDSREEIRVNQEVLEKILAVLPEIQRRLPGATAPSAEALLGFRGVLETVEIKDDEAKRQALEGMLLAGIGTCVERLAEMRADEGRRLGTILGEQLDRIDDLRGQAETLAKKQPEIIRRKIDQQLAELLKGLPPLSEERLAQEVAMLAAKADIREELDRLSSHLAAARAMLAEGGAVGRKLDFLCQEFNRETNTLCSKSGDVEMTRIGLDLKAVIEQFREQVQNVE
jgi:uncharacterized protein (TIGR00255 family)